MFRAQILLRPWGSAKEMAAPRWDSSGKNAIAPQTQIVLAMGVLEVSREGRFATMQDDTMRDIAIDLAQGRMSLGVPKAVGDENDIADTRICDLKEWLTRHVWRGPTAELPDHFAAGQIIGRRCRVEAAPDTQAVVFCGLVSCNAATLSDGPMFLHGLSENGRRFDVRDSGPGWFFVAPMGESATAELRAPQWGWGERVGLRSTMRLDIQDLCREADELRLAGLSRPLTAEEQARLNGLDRATGQVGGIAFNDARYVQLRRFIQDAGLSLGASWQPATRAELARQGRLMTEAIRAMEAPTHAEGVALLQASMSEASESEPAAAPRMPSP